MFVEKPPWFSKHPWLGRPFPTTIKCPKMPTGPPNFRLINQIVKEQSVPGP